jgi:glycosyltransferase involved in cell wall biosynthesis
MDVSFTNAPESMSQVPEEYKDIIGYSHAAYEILKAFDRAGIKTAIDEPISPIGISMGYPSDYKFYPNQYKIGYTAWESTELKENWLQPMLDVDELWATSSWTAEVFKETTGREDIHTYIHGISMDWKPIKRFKSDKFRFLHIGEPQYRKNGQLVIDAFIDLFKDNSDVQLIMKASHINTTRVFNEDGSIHGSPESKYKNIRIITDDLSHKDLIYLYHKCDALVYPTTGEGFGFIPLQALATGMPTISTWQWAEYKDFITNPLYSELRNTEQPLLHPGNTYYVEKEEVKKHMIDVYENYDKYVKQAYKNSFKIHMEYDWDRVSYDTINRIKKILKNRGL